MITPGCQPCGAGHPGQALCAELHCFTGSMDSASLPHSHVAPVPSGNTCLETTNRPPRVGRYAAGRSPTRRRRPPSEILGIAAANSISRSMNHVASSASTAWTVIQKATTLGQRRRLLRKDLCQCQPVDWEPRLEPGTDVRGLPEDRCSESAVPPSRRGSNPGICDRRVEVVLYRPVAPAPEGRPPPDEWLQPKLASARLQRARRITTTRRHWRLRRSTGVADLGGRGGKCGKPCQLPLDPRLDRLRRGRRRRPTDDLEQCRVILPAKVLRRNDAQAIGFRRIVFARGQ